MTDRAASLTVLLERETRDEDLEDLMKAIRQLRGVAKVEMVVDMDHYAAKEMAKLEYHKVLLEAIHGVLWPKESKGG